MANAQSLYDSGNYPEAAEAWRLIADGNSPEACAAAMSYANTLSKLNKDAEATKQAYLGVARRWPDSPNAPVALLRAANLASKADTKQAMDLYAEVRRAYAGTAESAAATLRLGYLCHRTKDLATAEQHFWEAAIDPKQTEANRAQAYKQYGFTAIMRYFQDADTQKPDAASHLNEARKRLLAASAYLIAHPEHRANAALCIAGVGESYLLTKNNYPEAEAAYRRALGECGSLPTNLEALLRHGLGIALCYLSRHDEGLTQLALAGELATKPGDAGFAIPADVLRFDSAIMAAGVLSGLGRNTEALAAVEPVSREAVEKAGATTNPRMSLLGARAITWEGIVLLRLGDRTSAAERFRQAQRLYPQATEQVETARILEQKVEEAK